MASLPSTVEPVVASTREPIATDSATAVIFLFASRPIAILSSPLKLLPAFTPIAILSSELSLPPTERLEPAPIPKAIFRLPITFCPLLRPIAMWSVRSFVVPCDVPAPAF